MKNEELRAFLIQQEASVVEAMQHIDFNGKGILFVCDEDQKLVGVITDGDIRRWLIKTGELNGRVSQIMNKTPKVIDRDKILMAKSSMQEHQITALPVLTKDGKVCDILFKEENHSVIRVGQKQGLVHVPVVIMAGGKGTRLYPYTKILPKPLIPIGDIPIMERIIKKFQEYGVEEFYATVNYKKTMIKSYFNDTAVDYCIRYVEEDMPLGTAGSLKLIDQNFETPFVVTNCDILVHADYTDIYEYHKKSGNELTMVTALKNIVVPYGVVHPSENGRIEEMEEKPKLSYFVNTGMYVLNPNLIEEIPEGQMFHMTHLADKLLKEGRKVGMYPISEDSFLDMGEFEEMHRMEAKLNLKSE